MKTVIYLASFLTALLLGVYSQAQVTIYTTGSGGRVIIVSSTYATQLSDLTNGCSCPQQNGYYRQPARRYSSANQQVVNNDLWDYSFQPMAYQEPIEDYPAYDEVYERRYSQQPVYQNGTRFSRTLSDISQFLDVATQAVDLYQSIRRYR